jgi:tetratricopeptide (TPR) repeat protein
MISRRRRKTMKDRTVVLVLMLSAAAAIATGVSARAAEDTVYIWKTEDGKRVATPLEGDYIVVQDDLGGVGMKSGAMQTKRDRQDVARVEYGNAPDGLQKAKAAIEEGDLQVALELLNPRANRAMAQLLRDNSDRAKLIQQYYFYYTARLFHERGGGDDLRRALNYYQQVLAKVPDSAVFFQTQLGIARVYEESGNLEKAEETYRLWATQFENRADKYDLGRWAQPYILLANVGQLRAQVKQFLAGRGGTDAPELNEFEMRLARLKRQAGTSPPERIQTALNKTEALIWRGQGEWERLVGYLDSEILEGQLENRQRELRELYHDRAQANFQLEDWRAAAVDYLRLWLEYDIQGELAAETHLRLGQCLWRMEIKENEWVKKAKAHFAQAKNIGAEPYSSEAKDQLKALNEWERGEQGAPEEAETEQA